MTNALRRLPLSITTLRCSDLILSLCLLPALCSITLYKRSSMTCIHSNCHTHSHFSTSITSCISVQSSSDLHFTVSIGSQILESLTLSVYIYPRRSLGMAHIYLYQSLRLAHIYLYHSLRLAHIYLYHSLRLAHIYLCHSL